MSQTKDVDYRCEFYSQADVNGLAMLVGSLIQENLEKHPERRAVARRIHRPVVLKDSESEACTLLFGADCTQVLNGSLGTPSICIIDTTGDQLLAVSEVKIRAGGLLPTGFFSKAGLAVIGAILRKELIVKGLVAHPITVLRLIALVSVD